VKNLKRTMSANYTVANCLVRLSEQLREKKFGSFTLERRVSEVVIF